MKRRPTTQTVSKKILSKSILIGLAVLIAGAGTFQASPLVFARDFDAEIQAKQREADRYRDEANKLATEADTLQRELNILANQIGQIQAEIEVNQAKHDNLIGEIGRNEKLIDDNRDALGLILSDMYVDDQISPLEMLASSQSIGDYIDKQEQRSTVRQGLNDKIKEIKDLQEKLEQQREEVKKVLDDQEMKRTELASKQSTQKNILDKTRGDEAAYQSLASDRQGEIDKLRQAQQDLQRLRQQGVGGGTYVPASGGGGYPYGHIQGCYTNACADEWALFYSECTSYVAWKLSSEGYGVRAFNWQGYPDGHAYQWTGSVTSYAVSKRDHSPKKGDAAVFPAGVNGAAWTGHVMYVEDVYSNGTILISEYNWDGRGSFSKRELTPGEYRNTVFITFPAR